MKQTKVRFNHGKLQYSALLMKALAHPLRLKILEYIDVKGITQVNNIYNTLGIEQSATSQHLRILKTAGVVTAKKEGKFIYYSVNYGVVERANIAVGNFLSH
jgi:ArsR family transcriptional regulator